MLNKKRLILLVCIFILGGAARFYKIDGRCFYGDELHTLDIISQPKAHAVLGKVSSEFNCEMPAFYIILYYWGLFCKSAFCLRTLSALSALLLILVAYKLARYLFDENTALLASFLVGISPFLILCGQVARYYSFNALFNLLSLYFFIKAMRDRQISKWFFYVAIRAFSIYINYSSFMFLAFEGAFALLYKKKYPLGFKRWLFCLVIIFILWLPASPYFIRDFDLLLSGEGLERIPSGFGWAGKLLYSFFVFTLGETVLPFNYPIVIVAGIVYLFILLSFFRMLLARRISGESAAFVILSLFIPAVLCAFSKHGLPRYIMAAVVPYYIIVSLVLLKSLRRVRRFLLIGVTLLSLYSLFNLYNERQYHNMELIDDWDEMAVYLNNHSNPSDIIIYDSFAFIYYADKIKSTKEVHEFPDTEEDMRIFLAEKLEKLKTSKILLLDSPLSRDKIEVYRKEEFVLFNNWLKENNFELTAIKGFDRDEHADKKRRYINRAFPEYRSSLYTYSGNFNGLIK